MSVFRRPVPTWVVGLLFILVPLQLFAYVNLEVSYKYEVDLAETMAHVTLPSRQQPTALRQIAAREQEIRGEQQQSLVLAAVAGSLAILLSLHNARLRRRPTPSGSRAQ